MKMCANFFDDITATNEFYVERVKFDFAKQIETLLGQLNLSRKDLADRLGKSRSYVTKFMHGDTNFTLESMVAIARALDAELVPPQIKHPCQTQTDETKSTKQSVQMQWGYFDSNDEELVDTHGPSIIQAINYEKGKIHVVH